MIRRLILSTLVVISALLFQPLRATAQQITTGIIQGSVADATGASLPGVTVEARNLDTNFGRTLVTEADGRFVFLQLAPGNYRVTCTLAGFATHVQENIVLTVGQAVTLPVAMKVSGVAETVTVTTATPVIETSRTASATTLNQNTIDTIPILGRKFEDLLTLTPGVAIVQGADGDEISFAGQRGIFNNISLDGGDYNNGFFGEQAGGQRASIDITLDAIKEFQVIATGAPAEFGRTAGGVVNVVTKSGTNAAKGSLFYFQRMEALTGDLSDGSKLEGFHREQYGGTFGGPIKKDKAFLFLAVEGINGNFERPNLSRQIGDVPCPVANPTVQQNEGLINGNADCQRTALLGFFQTRLNMDESTPIDHPQRTSAILGKVDVAANANNNFSGSWNFNHSRKTNETFDVATYGPSANGVEGDPARINVMNLNWFTTISARTVNEAHFTYSRESRPRTAAGTDLHADTGMGFGPSFRFGDPFFLQPERRRAHLADADQGQRLDRDRQAHLQSRRRVDAHAQRSGVSRVLYRPVHLRQRHRLPALRVAGGRGWIRSQHGWLLERDVCHVPDGVPGGIDDRRRTAPSVSPGCGSHRSRHRRGRRVGHLERRVLALRAGFVAGPAEPDAELRPALGLAADARDGRSHDDGVWGVSRRPDVPLGWHDPEPVEHVAAADWRGVGRQGRR